MVSTGGVNSSHLSSSGGPYAHIFFLQFFSKLQQGTSHVLCNFGRFRVSSFDFLMLILQEKPWFSWFRVVSVSITYQAPEVPMLTFSFPRFFLPLQQGIGYVLCNFGRFRMSSLIFWCWFCRKSGFSCLIVRSVVSFSHLSSSGVPHDHIFFPRYFPKLHQGTGYVLCKFGRFGGSSFDFLMLNLKRQFPQHGDCMIFWNLLVLRFMFGLGWFHAHFM